MRYLIRIVIAVWIIAGLGADVNAHGGGTPQLVNVDIGPYWISTWINPFPPQIDNFHLAIALSEPTDPQAELREAGPPIQDAQVEVMLQPLDGPSPPVSRTAEHQDTFNKLFYEADFVLPYAGLWRGIITVQGPDGGSGSIEFEVEVGERSLVSADNILIIGTVFFLIIVFIMIRRGTKPVAQSADSQ